jgi:hypothetical protein
VFRKLHTFIHHVIQNYQAHSHIQPTLSPVYTPNSPPVSERDNSSVPASHLRLASSSDDTHETWADIVLAEEFKLKDNPASRDDVCNFLICYATIPTVHISRTSER